MRKKKINEDRELCIINKERAPVVAISDFDIDKIKDPIVLAIYVYILRCGEVNINKICSNFCTSSGDTLKAVYSLIDLGLLSKVDDDNISI